MKTFKLYLLNTMLIVISFTYSQNQCKKGNIWYFGENAGLDFNSGSPIALTDGQMYTDEGCASIADEQGNLLFYTDGETVWSNNDAIMDGGIGLNGLSVSYPTTQGSLIVKRPNSSSIYYLFTASDRYGVNYSVINIQLEKNVKFADGLTEMNFEIDSLKYGSEKNFIFDLDTS